ncbi:MAG TPA: DUF5362 family protein [Puia sp.]|jgi:hypothetical protein
MEPNNTSENLFELQIDAQSNNHLSQAAKWAKFLAIVGFVFCGLLIIWGIYMEIVLNSFGRLNGEAGAPFGAFSNFGGAFFLTFAIAGAILYFFPCLYLFRFGSKMQTALRNNDQNTLTNSFSNLKSFYKFLGILTIIFLAIYLFSILMVMVSAATMR